MDTSIASHTPSALHRSERGGRGMFHSSGSFPAESLQISSLPPLKATALTRPSPGQGWSWPSQLSLVVSLHPVHTWVNRPFIKFSDYPIGACHLFPAGALTDTNVFRGRLATRQRDMWPMASPLCPDPTVGRCTNSAPSSSWLSGKARAAGRDGARLPWPLATGGILGSPWGAPQAAVCLQHRPGARGC